MHKLGPLVVCVLFFQLAYGQFSLGGGEGSSSSYPRIKLAGPLGQLIGGQGISLNSGLGQVLSSIINSATNAAQSSNSGGPLSQLATAASSNYINAIRSAIPFGNFGGSSQSSQQHSQYTHNAPGPHLYNGGMQSQLNFLPAEGGLYGGQANFDNGHFGSNSFSHFPTDNYFGGGSQFGGYNNGPSSSPIASSALYSSPNGYGSGHMSPSVQHLDKKK